MVYRKTPYLVPEVGHFSNANYFFVHRIFVFQTWIYILRKKGNLIIPKWEWRQGKEDSNSKTFSSETVGYNINIHIIFSCRFTRENYTFGELKKEKIKN